MNGARASYGRTPDPGFNPEMIRMSGGTAVDELKPH